MNNVECGFTMVYGNLKPNENVCACTAFVEALPAAEADQRVRHRGETAS